MDIEKKKIIHIFYYPRLFQVRTCVPCVQVFRIRGRDFPDLKLGIRDFKENSARDSGLKVCLGGAMPKITVGITGLREILGRDYTIEELCWEPSLHEQLKIKYNILHWNRSQ